VFGSTKLPFMWRARVYKLIFVIYLTEDVRSVAPSLQLHRYGDRDKKLIRRWDSERELSLRRHRARTTKYSRLVHKCRHRSTRLCVGTHVFTKFSEITQYNGHYVVQRHSRSPILDNRKLIYDFLLVINTNLPPILHRFQVMADYSSNFR